MLTNLGAQIVTADIGVTTAIQEGMSDLKAEYLLIIPGLILVALVPFGARRLFGFAKGLIK